MKMVVDLPEDMRRSSRARSSTRSATPSRRSSASSTSTPTASRRSASSSVWFDSPVRTAYRYLQHWMLHPYLWRYLEGGTLRSWGAKSLPESAGAASRTSPATATRASARARAARTCSPAPAWTRLDDRRAARRGRARTAARPGSRSRARTSSAAYVARRRASWVEREGRVAEKARDGFQRGFVPGSSAWPWRASPAGASPCRARRRAARHERVADARGVLRAAGSRAEEIARIRARVRSAKGARSTTR